MKNEQQRKYWNYCEDCDIIMDYEIVKHLTPEEAADPDMWVWCPTGQDLVPREKWLTLYEAWIKAQKSPKRVKFVVHSHFRMLNGQVQLVRQHIRKHPSGE